jgi:hypothetical protein
MGLGVAYEDTVCSKTLAKDRLGSRTDSVSKTSRKPGMLDPLIHVHEPRRAIVCRGNAGRTDQGTGNGQWQATRIGKRRHVGQERYGPGRDAKFRHEPSRGWIDNLPNRCNLLNAQCGTVHIAKPIVLSI